MTSDNKVDTQNLKEDNNQLGYCYQYGIDCDKDEKKAFQSYLKGSNLKDINATSNLAECYLKGIGCDKDETKAFELFILCAEQNHKESISRLAYYYKKGIGCKRNIFESLKYTYMINKKDDDIQRSLMVDINHISICQTENCSYCDIVYHYVQYQQVNILDFY